MVERRRGNNRIAERIGTEMARKRLKDRVDNKSKEKSEGQRLKGIAVK